MPEIEQGIKHKSLLSRLHSSGGNNGPVFQMSGSKAIEKFKAVKWIECDLGVGLLFLFRVTRELMFE